MKPLVFDIEVQPRPDEELKPFFDPPDESEFVVGPFDPGSVKLGNMKDEKKIAEKIQKAKDDHKKRAAEAGEKCEKAREAAWQKFIDGSTLNAAQSTVLAIGYYSKATDKFLCHALSDADAKQEITETDLLNSFWARIVKAIQQNRKIVGVNIFNYDLPVLFRRSLVNNVDVPGLVYKNRAGKWPEWNAAFVCLGKLYCSTTHPSQTKWGFQALAQAFGTGGKCSEDGISGGDFWRFWRDGGERRATALKYLETDVRQPAEWADRIGL